LHFHSHFGSAQTDSQTWSGHFTRQEAVLQTVVQEGQWPVEHWPSGQMTVQSGWSHSSEHPFIVSDGHRVSQTGAEQSGSQVCSQVCVWQDHVQIGWHESSVPAVVANSRAGSSKLACGSCRSCLRRTAASRGTASRDHNMNRARRAELT
jgi:hypothetical protein